jgi:hypothetical protein
MTMRSHCLILALGVALVSACGGGDDGDTSLSVTWSFEAGDCAANGVETVRVSWGAKGEAPEAVDFACADGQGELGNPGHGGTFVITAEGLGADGRARLRSNGLSVTFGDGGTLGTPIAVALYPIGSTVTVSWSLADGDTCPSGVILPYYVTLFVAPEQVGGELVDDLATIQASCITGQVSFPDVLPGDYVVEVDSRAVTPALRATAPVTVEPITDATVAVEF